MSNSRLLFLYGLAVIASGLGRFLFSPGGVNGLWFGFVMGGISLLGGFLLRKNNPLGLGLGFLAMAFIGGWFSYESFVIKGFATAEWRQLIMIVVSIISALLLFRSRKK